MRTIATVTAGLFAATALPLLAAGEAAGQAREIRWATSAVGSAGHRALVTLATVLNREMPELDITVLPTPGAIASVRGFAVHEFDGNYGADIAFAELATDSGRFTGFRANMQREPVQSFWAYTIEVGLAVRAADRERYQGWRDLAGRPVFTGPAPWDTRAQLERGMQALGVGHDYVEIDLGLAGSSLAEGTIDGFIVYTAGEAAIAPWIAEAELAAAIAVLNPSEEERALLEAAGLQLVSVRPDVFETDVHAEELLFLPFYYGFHVGLDLDEDLVFRMLEVIEAHAEELAATDPVYSQIVGAMPEMQRRGVAAAIAFAEVHPGLARYMRERGVWDEAWNDRIATQ